MTKKRMVGALALVLLAGGLMCQPDLPLETPGGVTAYKGLSHPVDYRGLDDKSCTADALTGIEHPFIENTLPAIAEAFDKGAETVHLNIHHTRDGRFAVFHDWRLECRTDGEGVTSARTSDYLKTLDVGYGYRRKDSDDYPLRGRGRGMMPLLSEVLAAFPGRRFLINMKTADKPAIARILDLLTTLLPAQRGHLAFIGDDAIAAAVVARFDEPRVFSKPMGKQCLIEYALYGWSRIFPASCARRELILPHKYARYLWGWPEQFAARVQAHGSRVSLYQTRHRYDPDYDYRRHGVGSFSGDILNTPVRPAGG